MMRNGVLPRKPVSIRSAEMKPSTNRRTSDTNVQSSVFLRIVPKVLAVTMPVKFCNSTKSSVKKGSFTLQKEKTTI